MLVSGVKPGDYAAIHHIYDLLDVLYCNTYYYMYIHICYALYNSYIILTCSPREVGSPPATTVIAVLVTISPVLRFSSLRLFSFITVSLYPSSPSPMSSASLPPPSSDHHLFVLCVHESALILFS